MFVNRLDENTKEKFFIPVFHLCCQLCTKMFPFFLIQLIVSEVVTCAEIYGHRTEGECDAQRPCAGSDEICHVPEHDNCLYCDEESHECKPGCADDSQCPPNQNGGCQIYVCVNHLCQVLGCYAENTLTIRYFEVHRSVVL